MWPVGEDLGEEMGEWSFAFVLGSLDSGSREPAILAQDLC